MECELTIHDHQNKIWRKNVTIVLAKNENIIDHNESRFYLEVHYGVNDVIIFPLYKKNIAILYSYEPENFIILALSLPDRQITFTKGTNEYYKLLVKNLSYIDRGNYGSVDVRKFKINNVSSFIMRVDHNDKLLERTNFDILKVLTITTPYEDSVLKLLEKCKNLEELSLIGIFRSSQVQFPEKFYNIIKSYTKLKYFMLNQNIFIEYEDIKVLLHSLPNTLLKLSLEDNGIIEFPDDFGRFRDLIDLNIGKNNITEVPTSILGCQNILYLNITTKNSLILYLPTKFWNYLDSSITSFGSYAKQRDQINDPSTYKKELQHTCNCYKNIKKSDSNETLIDICLRDLSKKIKFYNSPENMTHLLKNSFICDHCHLIRSEDGHRCFFERKTFVFNNRYIDDDIIYIGDTIEIYERIKYCKYCIS